MHREHSHSFLSRLVSCLHFGHICFISPPPSIYPSVNTHTYCYFFLNLFQKRVADTVSLGFKTKCISYVMQHSDHTQKISHWQNTLLQHTVLK